MESLNTGDVIAIVFLGLIIFITLIGNCVILLIILKTPSLRSSLTNAFVISLCVTGVLASLTIMPVAMINYIRDVQTLPSGICDLSGFMHSLLTFQNVFTICVISVERYFFIAHPMLHAGRLTSKCTIIILATTWCGSITLASIPFTGWTNFEYRNERAQCTYALTDHTPEKGYIITILTICFVLPIIIVICAYMAIFNVAREAHRQIGATTAIRPRQSVASISVSSTAYQARSSFSTSDSLLTLSASRIMASSTTINEVAANNEDTKLELNTTSYDNHNARKPPGVSKAAKTLLLVAGTFLVLFLPEGCSELLAATRQEYLAGMFPLWLTYCSFTVNPILYGFLNRSIRQEALRTLKEFFHCRLCYKQRRVRIEPAEDNAEERDEEDFFQFLERTMSFPPQRV